MHKLQRVLERQVRELASGVFGPPTVLTVDLPEVLADVLDDLDELVQAVASVRT